MYSKGQKAGTVKFSLTPKPGSKTVRVAGDFSDWRPVAMKKRKDGAFAGNVRVQLGRFEYKFIVDGEWIKDPDNSNWAMNPFGTFNSVGQVD